jgi:hypothetical protein
MQDIMKQVFIPNKTKVRFRIPKYDFDLEGLVRDHQENSLRIWKSGTTYEIPYSEIDLNNPENSKVRLLSEEEKAYQAQQAALTKRYASYGGDASMSDDPHYDPATRTYTDRD